MRVPEADLHSALQELPQGLRKAMTQAAANIRRYCEWQRPDEWQREIQPGVCVGQLVRPLESVGCYVPGGRYPLPSTLLMTVIPAQVAGVPQIRVVSPQPAQATLAAARIARHARVLPGRRSTGSRCACVWNGWCVRACRWCRGNRYVSSRRENIAFDCAIEFLAGPTEAVCHQRGG